MTNFAIRCAHTHVVDPSSLKPHPQNPNRHPAKQLEVYVGILAYQGWRRAITVSSRSGFVTKGHGALEAALSAGQTEVPIDWQDYPDEASEFADIVADNQLGKLAEMDTGALNLLLVSLDAMPSFDLKLAGFESSGLVEIQTGLGIGAPPPGLGDGDRDIYTKKIQAPIYEPKGDRPEVASLVDLAKTSELIAEIDSTADLPNEVRGFLRYAAQRHAVFDYEKIAEYYAHAPKDVQELMERSALVIIDFDKAIEGGFIALSEAIAGAYKDAE